MKKRSLFAAVAMLLVSALVLTSATYAWFVVGTDAHITGIGAKIATASSGVQVRLASGGQWTGSLSGTTLATDTTNNKIPAVYKPASVASATGSSFSCLAGEFGASGSSTLTVTNSTEGTDYATYKVMVRRTDATGNVTCTPSITPASGSDANKAFKVAIEYYDGSNLSGVLGIWGDAGYKGINTAGSYTDANGDKIITSDAAPAGDGATAAALTDITVSSTGVTLENVTATGDCYILIHIWCEGNDPDCTNALSTQEATVAVTLAAA